ncbi:hypothetical protein DFR24_1100 [Panacagrimonas perspica]|uniref:Uncharacterized protein n=1 Tax=Panacagrimonas perspica TaxID=381431 RepID=A0A4R7PDV9_9GAMM|nr:hypothetical protein [Panacagrimonas perspica]TDU31721.1 hypothetical protein DFR24_1100 [Panacagrimonas perspica]
MAKLESRKRCHCGSGKKSSPRAGDSLGRDACIRDINTERSQNVSA